MGTIAASPLNRYSFLRFSEGAGFTTSGGNVTSPIVVTPDYTNYFNPFRLEGFRNSYCYKTPIIHGDTDSFFTVTLESGTFSSNSVIIFNEATGTAVQGATATATLFNSSKSILIRISYSGTASDLPVTARLLVGTNKVSNSLNFCKKGTNPLYLAAPQIEYSGLTDWYDFSYDFEVTVGDYMGIPFNRFRILASQMIDSYPNNSTEYRNITDNRVRILKQSIDKNVMLKTYQFDSYAHEAMAVSLTHSTFKMNGLVYKLAGGESYNSNDSEDMPISNGEVLILEDRFTRKNKPCPTIDES